jgi:hypothetical protein
MFKLKLVYIGSIVALIFLICLVVVPNGYANPEGVTGNVSTQHKMTPEEIAKQKENTEAIYIKGIGEFRRVSSVPSVNPSEILHSKDFSIDLMTKKTKVMILDYGIFVKVRDLD